MKNIKLLTGLLLFTFLVSCSSTPKTKEETETILVGTWDNTRGISSFEFHSDGRGYTDDLDPIFWKVTGPGSLTVTIIIKGVGPRNFKYQFTSMEEFGNGSGGNSFKKKNSIDHRE